VSSNDDGPMDEDIKPQARLIIPIPDRITFFTSILGNKRVHPGDNNLLNIAIGAYNSYKTKQVIKSLSILNIGSARTDEINDVEAFADLNEDGLFEPNMDSLLQVATSTDAGYRFDDLNIELNPYKNTLIFIAYSLDPMIVRDSVKVDFQVSDKSSVVFEGTTPNVQGDFPLNSAGVDITDGMVAAQLTAFPTPKKRVSPEDLNVLCFALRVPCDGSIEDVLNGIRVVNEGSARQTEDIEYLRLWEETETPESGFDPGEDRFLDFLAWNGTSWASVSQLSDTIPCSGLTLYMTADVSSTAGDGRTIRLSVPKNGIEVSSGNDGPVDRSFDSPTFVVITTDPLFSSIEAPREITAGQTFNVKMSVSNAADTALKAIAPDSFSYSGSGGVEPVSGPVPPIIDNLNGQADSAFTWEFRAVSNGVLLFCGKAVETDGTESSLMSCSDTVLIDDVPDNFTLELSDLAPVSLNRGREHALLLEMNMDYLPTSSSAAKVELDAVKVSFKDQSGLPLPINEVASVVRLEDDEKVIGYVLSTGITNSSLLIPLTEPLLFSPNDSAQVRLSVDIADTAAADGFVVSIESAAYIELRDHNNWNSVTPTGPSFPWSTNPVTIKDPAQELTVSFGDSLPRFVNKGQKKVKALSLKLINEGGSSSSDISVSQLRFHLFSSTGDTLDAGEVLRRFSITGELGTEYYSTEIFNGSDITCSFVPSLVISPQSPLLLHALVDCTSDPNVEGFSIRLLNTDDITPRDVNSGQIVPVFADTSLGQDFPLATKIADFLDPVSEVDVEGIESLPSQVVPGASGIEALSIVLTDPGSNSESNARCNGLGIRVLNERGEGVEPLGLIDAVRIVNGSRELGSIFLTVQSGPDLYIPFGTPFIISPSTTDTLKLYVDLSASASPRYFQLHVNSSGLCIYDDTDAKRIESVVGEFPLASGIARIVEPASSVFFNAVSKLSGNITASSEVPVFDISLRVDSSEGQSDAVLERLDFEVLDGTGKEINPSGVVSNVRVLQGSRELGVDWTAAAGRISLNLVDSVIVTGADNLNLTLKIEVAENPPVDLFQISIGTPSDVSCFDVLTHSAVSVFASAGGSFPYYSGKATILKRDLRSSFTNYPNPFNPGKGKTNITFYLPGDSRVTLRVFTITGIGVKTIISNEFLHAGLHQDYHWDGKNGNGVRVLNGVYYLVLDVSASGKKYVLKRKVAVVR